MALSVEQLKQLAALYDEWQAATTCEPDERSEALARVELEATAQGPEFRRAFDAMVAQAGVAGDATHWQPISESVRDAAIAASAAGTGLASDRRNPNSQFTLDALSRLRAQRGSGQHIGPYRLIKEIGRGGMGVVWLAARADGQHERQVALKMPLVENLNWLLAARFARERNILASLEHPGIARLYDAGVDDTTQPYIAIEYVQGQPITDYVKEKKLAPEATVQLFSRAIEAVAHAHAQLVIHRDPRAA